MPEWRTGRADGAGVSWERSPSDAAAIAARLAHPQRCGLRVLAATPRDPAAHLTFIPRLWIFGALAMETAVPTGR
jgi:hypothetical protein